MVGFARYLSAILVAITVVAAQVIPSWAGCHFQRHFIAMTDSVKVKTVEVETSSHHGMSHAVQTETEVSPSATDQPQPSQKDVCLGNCGCACGLTGAFVAATAISINAPHGVALSPEFVAAILPLGERPEGPRRPPRIAA